ncbi:MAG: hypothetical protein HZB80_02515 [Deltaproteobacteria bacterium]|nr:hypothetical protein [Deltaproteobacteria bacterium]
MTTFEILSLIAMFVFGAVAMWFTARSSRFQYLGNKALRHCIAKLSILSPSTIIAVITNNSPNRITVKSVKVQKKLIGPIYLRPLPASWTLPRKPAPIHIFDATDALMSHVMAEPQYVIETQSTINIQIDKLAPRATYKVLVTTTGGQCQSTYRFQ